VHTYAILLEVLLQRVFPAELAFALLALEVFLLTMRLLVPFEGRSVGECSRATFMQALKRLVLVMLAGYVLP
jgi:hypothetical protein